MRYLYSFLFYLILPFIFVRLLWKSRRLPAYRKRLGERLGFYPFQFEKSLWVHAVSVGEVIAALPMIKALKQQYPHLPMLITTMTPTGAERVKNALGDTVTHAYIPYDFPGAAARFLSAASPVAAIIMETELWPNLFAACEQRNIPVGLLNARLSQHSADGYRKVMTLTRKMLSSLAFIAANSEADAKRFLALGAPADRVNVTGNIKFDLELPTNLVKDSEHLKTQLGNRSFIWIAASTHEGEEEMMLAAHATVREKNPNALLILVPRHPDRFDRVAKLCESLFAVQRRSENATLKNETAVFLGDTMGELLLLYNVSDVVYVGGSLVPHGGHNMVEPAALGKPVIIGSHLRNFYEVSRLFLKAHALYEVQAMDEFTVRLKELMDKADQRETMGHHAKQVVADNRGVLVKQLSLVSELLI